MKKVLLSLLAILCLSACTQKIYMHSYTFDLKKYNDNGIFITESNSVSFEYQPIGLVQTVGGGAKKEVDRKRVTYTTLSQQEVFDAFVKECQSKGANAIINVSIEQIANKTNNATYRISGMAIKR